MKYFDELQNLYQVNCQQVPPCQILSACNKDKYQKYISSFQDNALIIMSHHYIMGDMCSSRAA